ncbi:MAG: hypothetical protein GQ531_01950 [Sulfurovum sp.]|nr:hypothetical protein [Sulfurovum sp.]
MTNLTKISLSLVTMAALSGCGDTTINQAPSSVTITGDTIGDTTTGLLADSTEIQTTGCAEPQTVKTLAGNISTDMDLTADTLWLLDGLVVIQEGATLTIEPCTTIAGMSGTGDNTSYMIIDKGAQIIADGTEEEPIVFTSSEVALNGETPEWGQWGGLTIIGHAGNDQVNAYEVNEAFAADATNMQDNSGVLRNVKIFNSGITMEQDKEINGISFVGVGSGTIVENITVDKSDDDCIEIWGGTVNLSNILLSNCSDDHFDIDDGYEGTVKNLVINQTTGNAGIEMSGHTVATFDGFTITQDFSNKEGGIYFKKDAIGGHFKNGTIIDNSVEAAGTIHSVGLADIDNISFENVTLEGSSSDARFTGDDASSAIDIEAIFNAGTGNIQN